LTTRIIIVPHVTIEFNLPDEQPEYDACVRASSYRSALLEIDELLRAAIKYGVSDWWSEELGDHDSELLSTLRTQILQIADDNGVRDDY
jgi:hypothetical protein